MNFPELRKELKAGRIRPAYLLAGDEPLLRDDALRAIKNVVLEKESTDFNFDRLEGGQTSAAALRDAMGLLPLMASRRLVVLREPVHRKASSKLLLEALVELLGQSTQEITSVLVVIAGKTDGRSAWVKSFKGEAVVVECVAPRSIRDLVRFIKDESTAQKVKFEASAAELLAEQIGPQLLMLRQEVAKAALIAGTEGPVTRSHVQEMACQVAEEPIWDLTDAIGEGRAGAALDILHRMLISGAPTPVLLGSLAAHFRKLIRHRAGGQVLGPPFVVRKIGTQAGRYSKRRLLSALEAIHEMDEILKGKGGLPADLALEQLVLELAA